MADQRTLRITLKREPFDAIYRGEKVEEYRTFSKFWISRLLTWTEEDGGRYEVRPYDTILFRNGYQPDSPTMEVEWKGLVIDVFEGVPESAPDEERYLFVIQLGRVLATEHYDG